MAQRIVYAQGNEVLDELIHRVDTLTPGRVEAVLTANPGLNAQGTHLPAGFAVILPAAQPGRTAARAVNLWD